ncbi:MAG: SDR family oxidoreductase [Bryobacteraceae bacterium]
MVHPHNPEVVVITGATAGVGRAVARAYARRGASIGLIARGPDGLDATRREVEHLGGHAVAVEADVADAEAIERAAERIEWRFGPIDIWINNAMTTVFSPFLGLSAEEFRRVTEVTYLGYVHGTMSALHRMFPRNRGCIVQVGSALAYRSIPLQSAYCGAKHAIVGFTDSIRSELIHEGSSVHITAVHLPAVNTPQFSWCRTRLPGHPQPVPPIYQPEIMAKAIVWAAAQRRREVWVGWPTIKAILGQKFIPGWLDHYLADYQSQQLDEPVDIDRRDNLFEPLPGDWGARGIFDDRAWSFSPQVMALTHGSWLLRLGAGLVGFGLAALAGRNVRNRKGEIHAPDRGGAVQPRAAQPRAARAYERVAQEA